MSEGRMLGRSFKRLKNAQGRSVWWVRLVPIVLVLIVMYFIESSLPIGLVLSSDLSQFIASPWTLFTYGTVHHSLAHLITSLILLSLIGYYSRITSGTFYLTALGGIGAGGLFFLLVYGPAEHSAELSGVSAGICALIPLLLLDHPADTPSSSGLKIVRLLFLCVVAGDVVYSLMAHNAGVFAHLGGYLVGTLTLLRIRKGQLQSEKVSVAMKKLEHSGYASLTDDERSLLSDSSSL